MAAQRSFCFSLRRGPQENAGLLFSARAVRAEGSNSRTSDPAVGNCLIGRLKQIDTVRVVLSFQRGRSMLIGRFVRRKNADRPQARAARLARRVVATREAVRPVNQRAAERRWRVLR